MVIAFEPEFNIGDIVSLKIKPETKMVVDGYFVRLVDRGKVLYFTYGLYDDTGATFNYTDMDLQLVEALSA